MDRFRLLCLLAVVGCVSCSPSRDPLVFAGRTSTLLGAAKPGNSSAAPKSPTSLTDEELREVLRQACRNFADPSGDATLGVLAAAKERVTGHELLQSGLIPSPDQSRLLLVQDSMLLLLDASTGDALGCAVAPPEQHYGQGAEFTPDGSSVLVQELGASDAAVWLRASEMSEVHRVATHLAVIVDNKQLIAAVPGSAFPFPEAEGSTMDDDVVLYDVLSSQLARRMLLTSPPNRGLASVIASLPTGMDEDRFEGDDFRRVTHPTGRRIQTLRVDAGIVLVGYYGGSVALFRIADGKLLGSYRPRIEGSKAGLAVVHPATRRAAISTAAFDPHPSTSLPKGLTALVELGSGSVTHVLDACSFPSGYAFSTDGAKLMVGDLLHACLHDVATGRLLAKTKALRPSWGEGDDAKDVFPTALPFGGWLLATTMAFGVVDDRGTLQLAEEAASGPPVVSPRGDVVYLTVGETSLLAIRPGGLTRRPLSVTEQRLPESVPELLDARQKRLERTVVRASEKLCRIGTLVVPDRFCFWPS